MRTKRIVGPALLLVLFATLLVQLPLAIADRASVYEWFAAIQDIRFILAEHYVRRPDPGAMERAMIDAMVDVLDDPYTLYIPPEDAAEFNKQLRGTYAGIGAEVNVIDGYLTIVTPMDDSPALRAGVMAGDVVLEIEGETTFEVPVTTCVEMLTGEPGTPVTIRVRHLDGVEEELSIVRARIVTQTVKGIRRVGEAWSWCLDDELDVAYVRVTQFNMNTVDELRHVLAEQIAQGLGGLVLDLRDNPGGGLPVAVSMADLFLDEGVIVSVRPREGKGDAPTYRASAEGTLPEFPMVVVVNGQSASASEIVAGALQDNGRATILGTRTFGKGSVQEVRDLRDNAGTLKFTTAYYYLPSGRNINKTPDGDSWGVDPDPGLVVPVRDEDLLERFRARRDFEIIRDADDADGRCVDAAWIRESLRDEQLAVAAEAIRTRLTTDAWPKVSDEDSAEVALGQEIRRHARDRLRYLERIRWLEERMASLREFDESGREASLLPDVDLTGGTLAIHDRDGNTVGTFRIEGGDLDLALKSIMLERLE